MVAESSLWSRIYGMTVTSFVNLRMLRADLFWKMGNTLSESFLFLSPHLSVRTFQQGKAIIIRESLRPCLFNWRK